MGTCDDQRFTYTPQIWLSSWNVSWCSCEVVVSPHHLLPPPLPHTEAQEEQRYTSNTVIIVLQYFTYFIIKLLIYFIIYLLLISLAYELGFLEALFNYIFIII